MKFTFQLGIQDIQQMNRKLKLLIVLSVTKVAQKTEREADEKLGGALQCRGQGSLPEDASETYKLEMPTLTAKETQLAQLMGSSPAHDRCSLDRSFLSPSHICAYLLREERARMSPLWAACPIFLSLIA